MFIKYCVFKTLPFFWSTDQYTHWRDQSPEYISKNSKKTTDYICIYIWSSYGYNGDDLGFVLLFCTNLRLFNFSSFLSGWVEWPSRCRRWCINFHWHLCYSWRQNHGLWVFDNIVCLQLGFPMPPKCPKVSQK